MALWSRWGSGYERPSYRGLQRLQRQWARGYRWDSPAQTTTGGTRRHAGWNRSANTKRYLDDGFPSHAELEAEIAQLTSVGNLFRQGYIRINLVDIGLGPLVDAVRKWPKKSISNVLKDAVKGGSKILTNRQAANPDVKAIFSRVVKNRTGALQASLGQQYRAPVILSGGAAFQKFRARLSQPSGKRPPDPSENTPEAKYSVRNPSRPPKTMTQRSYWKPTKGIKTEASKLWITRTLKNKTTGGKEMLTKRRGSVGGDEPDTIKPYKYAHLVERGTRFGGWRKTQSKPKPFFRAIYYARRGEVINKMVDGMLVGVDREITRLLKVAENGQRRLAKTDRRNAVGPKK